MTKDLLSRALSNQNIMTLDVKLALVSLLLVETVRGNVEPCASSSYTQSGFQLQGHAIKKMSTASSAACMEECRQHNKCFSINYHKDNGTCELNAANHLTNPKSLMPSKGFEYRQSDSARSPSNCSINYCSRKTDKCLIESNGIDYKCLPCKGSGYQEVMIYATATTKNKVVLENQVESMNAFTACAWVQPVFIDQKYLTIFSYAVNNTNIKYSANEIVIDLHKSALGISQRTAYASREAPFPLDGKWHQFCTTWENTQGKWKIYIDGNMTAEGMEYADRVIYSGAVVLGQDQDSYKGGFQQSDSYTGNLTNVNLWDKVLTSQEVADLSRSCAVGEGNVLKWSDFSDKAEGDIEVVCSMDCVSK